jgi:hypothetical protein
MKDHMFPLAKTIVTAPVVHIPLVGEKNPPKSPTLSKAAVEMKRAIHDYPTQGKQSFKTSPSPEAMRAFKNVEQPFLRQIESQICSKGESANKENVFPYKERSAEQVYVSPAKRNPLVTLSVGSSQRSSTD